MNENAPSYFQLMTSFDSRCTHQCKTCRFGGIHCRAEFFYDILTGSMTLNDSFKKPNKEESKPKFPARDIVTAFARHCERCDLCADCRFYDSGTTVGECIDAYMEQLDSGKMTLEDSFKEDKK